MFVLNYVPLTNFDAIQGKGLDTASATKYIKTGALCEPNIYCFWVDAGWIFVDSKRSLEPSVVYTTDRSKAVIQV